jgi:hypothetical protein
VTAAQRKLLDKVGLLLADDYVRLFRGLVDSDERANALRRSYRDRRSRAESAQPLEMLL